jgi:Asp-tRNA(Asn)/Glu-tRNA(Gln) amidotransferase A subunit family amidase
MAPPAPPDDLAFASVVELGRLLRQKQTSATELASYFLDRIERIGSRYNAVVTLRASARLRKRPRPIVKAARGSGAARCTESRTA